MGKRIYVLDTNILIHDPKSLLAFDDRDVVIPMVVTEELDDKKNAKGEVGYNAREAIRILQKLRKHGNLCTGVATEHGGTISICDYSLNLRAQITETGSYDIAKPDNKILLTAATVARCNPGAEVFLVTNDANLQIKSDGLNSVLPQNLQFGTQFYRRDRLEDKDFEYKGRRVVEATEDRIFGNSLTGVEPAALGIDQDDPHNALLPNEYIEIRHPSGNSELGRFCGGYVHSILPQTVFGATSRNVGQIFALHALMAPVEEIPLVILRGPAGTAKTFLTLAAGLEQTYEQQLYSSILYTRANVEFDREIGALPGDEQEKMGPLVRPCTDNIEALFNQQDKRHKRRANTSVHQ